MNEPTVRQEGILLLRPYAHGDEQAESRDEMGDNRGQLQLVLLGQDQNGQEQDGRNCSSNSRISVFRSSG